jgi:hypothetical protein
VTEIEYVEPVTPSTALQAPLFYLLQAEGGRYYASGQSRAVLFQGERLVDLGRPSQDQVDAWGARPGDRLCVFDPGRQRLGCEVVAPPREHLELYSLPGWQPELVVTPVTSRTVQVRVTAESGLALWARLYPLDDPAPPEQVLVPVGSGIYSGTFHLEEPSFQAHVHVWVEEAGPQREAVSDYAIGGNPAMSRGRRAMSRGRRAMSRGRRAPVLSADGQAILYGEGLEFGEGEFFAWQTASVLPDLPSWATAVGQGYRLTASPGAPPLSGTSLRITYQGDDVLPGDENWLRVYYHDGEGWQPLDTYLDTDFNYASAPTQGAGLYVLLSSMEIPLYGPGWNLFAYPVEGTRPVTEALRSIDGYYTTVYGWEAQDPDPFNRWRVYDVTMPPALNDLGELAFGQGYWITVTQGITLYLKGGTDAGLDGASAAQNPPATYYGRVVAGPGFAPASGMEVTAWVGESLCGRTQTAEVEGQVMYAVQVYAEGPGDWTGCGAAGRPVTFQIGSQAMVPHATWNNNRVWEVALSAETASVEQVYLPLIVRGR